MLEVGNNWSIGLYELQEWEILLILDFCKMNRGLFNSSPSLSIKVSRNYVTIYRLTRNSAYYLTDSRSDEIFNTLIFNSVI